ncbi:Gustatory and odorant receptor 24 [Dissostichus eleginoides]|uniref:Gustatory and odorant receptor 24 n=1 Tax=Dissostichus eleginoides TaxID=100907 RepID=A0AAD9BQ17_DISEL|nr:Gustatory and odorant receptor 24 [Dissostichus eleginoides]
MSHRWGALGAVHHHRRSPRHVRPAVRGSSASGPGTRRGRRARDSGFSSAATDLPGRERREGKRIAIEEERESRPDVKPRAAGAKRRNVMLG